MNELLAQLRTDPGDVERWLACAAIIGALVALALKFRHIAQPNGHVTRAEHREFRTAVTHDVAQLRDRLEARHLATLERLEHMQASLQSEAERRDATMHRRLATMEAGLARLDERSRKPEGRSEKLEVRTPKPDTTNQNLEVRS